MADVLLKVFVEDKGFSVFSSVPFPIFPCPVSSSNVYHFKFYFPWKLSLISTKESNLSPITFSLSNVEVNFSGTRVFTFSFFSYYYPVDYGFRDVAEHWSYGGLWISTAIRTKWDPGGSFPYFLLWLFSSVYGFTFSVLSSFDQWHSFYRSLVLVWFGKNVLEGLELGRDSVNSFSPHIWGTVNDALTRTNEFALEACLWIELSGTITVFHPGKRLWCSSLGFLHHRSGSFVCSGSFVLGNTIHGFTYRSVYLDDPACSPTWCCWISSWMSSDRCSRLMIVSFLSAVRFSNFFYVFPVCS